MGSGQPNVDIEMSDSERVESYVVPCCDKKNDMILIPIFRLLGQNNEKTGMPKPLGTLYQNIGSLLAKQKDRKKALFYYHKSLDIFHHIGNHQGRADVYHCIADIHTLQRQNSKALALELKSLAIADSIHDTHGVAQAQLSIGTIYVNQGDPEKALSFLSLCLTYFENQQNMRELADLHNKMGACYFALREYGEANIHYYKTLAISEKIQLKDLQSEELGISITSLFGQTLKVVTLFLPLLQNPRIDNYLEWCVPG